MYKSSVIDWRLVKDRKPSDNLIELRELDIKEMLQNVNYWTVRKSSWFHVGLGPFPADVLADDFWKEA